MAELRDMTVRALRELARKVLGRGHSKLKTKAELVAALQAVERRVSAAAGKAASRIEKVVGTVRSKRTGAGAAGKRGPSGAGRGAAAGAGGGPPPRGAGERREAEPDPEGYMVARVAGEDALREAPHPLTESACESDRGRARHGRASPAGASPAPYQEHLGELPWSYSDDALVALPRDPRTLFLYWDHAPDTLRLTWEGLDGGRPQIWLFAREGDGTWARIRTVDFALESRSYYLHELSPGRTYRVEIHVVDRQGREKLLPRVSNEVMLPPVGPSPVVDDRFMRIPWSEPLQRPHETQPGGPFPEDARAQLARLSDWSRFAAPVWGGSAGGMGGRPLSGAAVPSSPSSPSAPWGPSGEGR